MNLFFIIAIHALIIAGIGRVPSNQTTTPVAIPPIETPIPVFQGKMMQSMDMGQTWENISNGLPDDMKASAVGIAGNQVYVGFVKDKLFVRGSAPVNFWTKENLDKALSKHTYTNDNPIAGLFPTQSGVYAYVIRDGLYKTQHSKPDWMALPTPQGVYQVNDIKEDEAGNVYLACQDGIYFSSDGGQTWERRFKIGWALQVEIQNNTIIASGKGGLYSSDDSGTTWKKLPIRQDMAFQYIRDDNVSYKLMRFGKGLAALRSETPANKGLPGKLQISMDGGKTWQIPLADDSLKNLEGITTVFFDEGKIYCSFKTGIICSEDNGRIWKTLLRSESTEANTSLLLHLSGGILYCTEAMLGC